MLRLLLALSFLVACTPARGRGGGGGGGGDDDDTVWNDDDAADDDDTSDDDDVADDDDTSDDDDAGDDDTGDDDDDTAPAPCGLYSPFDVVGGEATQQTIPAWESEYGQSSTWTLTMVGASTWRGQSVWVIDSEGSTSAPSFDYYDWSSTSYYACDAQGVHVLGNEMEVSYSISGTPTAYTSTTVYSSDWLMQPAGLQVGDAWTVDVEGDYSDSTGTNQSVSFGSSYEAVSSGQVTTPAGTFTGLRIENWADGADLPSFFWLVPGIGPVMTETYSHLTSTTLP